MVFRYFFLLLFVCFILLCQSLGHFNCIYKYIEGGVSTDDAKFILKKHNDLRNLIATGQVPGQPKGTDFKELKWDDELARQAQIVANTCIYKQVPVNDSRWPVGQNLYRRRSNKPYRKIDWDRAIQVWFDEHKKYTYDNFTAKCFEATGHYTQLIWADTEYVGCGYAFFETKEKLKYQKLYVCNYGPAGNVIGVIPYKTEN